MQVQRSNYQWGYISAGIGFLLAACVLWGLALSSNGSTAIIGGDLGLTAFGWGAFVEWLSSLGWLQGQLLAKNLSLNGLTSFTARALTQMAIGAGAWGVGWVALILGIRFDCVEFPPTEAARAPLFPRLSNYRAFHGTTLLAYGVGILFSEAVFVLLYTAFASSSSQPSSGLGVSGAFGLSLLVSCGIAFVGGFLGTARSRRLAIPEMAVAVLYFGLPMPTFLMLVNSVTSLSLEYGEQLKEVMHLAGLLGRPELGIWLVYGGLVLMLLLGMTTGFVATGSGRVDVRAGFELFVAARHVSVFRPGILLGTFVVLCLGVVPPLLVFAILQSARKATEKARIRHWGLSDPLVATAALNDAKKKEQTPTAMMTALSVGGVGVGVMSLIIVLSVMSGFELDLQKKILGTNAHAVVLKYSDSMPEYVEVMEKSRTVSGVVGATPFIHGEVMVSSEGNLSGALIKGIDPQSVGQVTDLPDNILPGGALEFLEKPESIPKRISPLGGAVLDERGVNAESKRDDNEDELDALIMGQSPSDAKSPDEVLLPGILVGKELAVQLRVSVGDRINVVSPLGGELGPSGPMPKSRPFRVGGIFYTGMFEYDSKMVYIHLKEAQKFFGVDGATGVELKVKDVDDARRITRRVYEKLDGYPFRTKDWGEMNKNLFSALRLEKLVMSIILTIIVIVAAGLIVATVIMLVLEKRKEIAVLKALGVPDGGIVKIFLAEGLQIGVAGGILGLLAGLSWCFIIEKVGIKLDPEVYYIPALPVRIEPLQTALSVVVAILVTFLASIYPALKASQVEPVDGLKAE